MVCVVIRSYMQTFFYSDGTETPNGPHEVSKIGDLLRDRVITASTPVWRPGDAAWEELASIPEYKKVCAARAPKLPKIPTNWAKWCKSGSHQELSKAEAVRRCLENGQVRGYFSDIVLNPDLVQGDSMYPSFEHLSDPTNHADAVVEARIINGMKSHLSEAEFWRVIEHLFIVGVEKSKIKPPFGKRLPRSWSPKRHYYKRILIRTGVSPAQEVLVPPKVVTKIGRAKSK